MKIVLNTRRRVGQVAFVITGLMAQALCGQEFVRIVPPRAGMSDVSRRGVYDTDELQGGVAAGPNPAGDTVTTDDPDQLIAQYRREAGLLGPSKWFSASKVGFRFGVGVAYDDNIRSGTGEGSPADEITTLTGGVTVSLGDYTERQRSYLLFSYLLAENIFAVHTDETALDQDGLVDALYRWDRSAVEVSSRFQSVHDTTSDVTTRERRYLYDESAVFSYHYGDKTLIQNRFSYDRTDASLGDSNYQYAWTGTVDYQVFDRIKLGVGVGVGRLEAEGNWGETFEQGLARLEYQLTGKVLVTGELGVDIRERPSDLGTSATPVFALEGRWMPYDGTTLSISGYRRVEASESLLGEDFTDSTVQADFRQRFFRHFYFLASAGYTHSDYEALTRSPLPGRTDDYYSVRTGVSYEAQKYFDVGLYYQRLQNDSTQSPYSYASDRVYLQSNFVY